MTRPDRIEYQGPERWRIVTDEDGVSIRTPDGAALEQVEAEQMFQLFHEAAEQYASGTVPVPRPPSREELRAMTYSRREDYAARRAVRAVKQEFDTPF